MLKTYGKQQQQQHVQIELKKILRYDDNSILTLITSNFINFSSPFTRSFLFITQFLFSIIIIIIIRIANYYFRNGGCRPFNLVACLIAIRKSFQFHRIKYCHSRSLLTFNITMVSYFKCSPCTLLTSLLSLSS